MKILSLDLSTKSTGWAIGENQQLLAHGCIVKNSKNVIARIVEMKNEINNLIQTYHIEKIIMEEVRPDYNAHTGKVLMWLQAAVVIVAYENNPKIECDFIGASSWRAILSIKQGKGIKREQLKPKDVKYVQDKYNITVNDDEADAICIFDSYFLKISNEINWQ